MLHAIRSPRLLVSAAYLAFVLIGIGAGAGGVLIASQVSDYGVGKTLFGITFFGGSAGFALAGVSAGWLDHRVGRRACLVGGGSLVLLAGLATASRPPFWAFAALTLVSGYGTGVLESVLNTCLAEMPTSGTLLNRLHAFFGVGALVGPVFAERMLRVTSWQVVVLTVALMQIPVKAALAAVHPDETHARAQRHQAHADAGTGGRPAASAWASPAVRWACLLLSLYVGVELTTGNWGFTLLRDARGLLDAPASLTMSGFWLGLTLGRFVLASALARVGIGVPGLMTVSIVGTVLFTAALAVPVTAVSVPAVVLLGFLLGPVFPTAMAAVPLMVRPSLVPAAIGLVNAGSTVGAAFVPWFGGVIGQHAGMTWLPPFLLLLAACQLLAWWRMAPHLRHGEPAVTTVGSPAA
ncbi:MAG: MFS transporter [Kineosporiaceae bacterium]